MATAVATQPTNGTLDAASRGKRLIVDMANRFGVDPNKMLDSIKQTAFGGKGSEAEFIAFMIVADQYGLNPFTKEIFAFPKQGGGVQNIVSVDGWCNIINSHPQMDGAKFDDIMNDAGELVAVKCTIFRKDRSMPTECTEYMAECKRGGNTPWATWPRRMLRHKALIQCARYAFGFSGIVDQDEAERGEAVTITASQPVHAKAKPSPTNALLSAPQPERQEVVEADPVYEAEPEAEQPEPQAMTEDEKTLAGFEALIEATDSIIKIESFRDKGVKEHPHLETHFVAACEARVTAIKGSRGANSNAHSAK